MNSKAPRRAVVLTAIVDGDTREDVSQELERIADRIRRKEVTTGVVGGVSSGTIYEFLENEGPSHEEYFVQVQRYLEDCRRDS